MRALLVLRFALDETKGRLSNKYVVIPGNPLGEYVDLDTDGLMATVQQRLKTEYSWIN